MSAQGNVAPIIIKKKKSGGGDGHHGGAWKVAYADFVTAMMAFFMLMWLLNATTEKQRKGLADYFSPSIPLSRVSGGGNGAFSGDSMFTEEIKPQNGTGATDINPTDAQQAKGDSGTEQDKEREAADEQFRALEEQLKGRGGESMVSIEMAQHIITRVTDEGLVVELFDTEESPLFKDGTAEPTLLFRDIVKMVSRVTGVVENNIAIGGHIRSHAVVVANNPVWELSHARADATRMMLESGGTKSKRMHRVTGHADRKLTDNNPMSARNNRVEIILLRK
ncbi:MULTISPECIES: flagellar motor protein MotB [Phaeobacter]|uniref:flagellar motor protein MotB n=1 Tax=Phaeobacter TaxID=302485 RepID=UPI00058D466E|nr:MULTISPECIES: flagellar motor protein MotB [Phaeobacter]ATG41401.1 chemotaxis protein MotB-like protein [Phaeobacter piscinae]KII17398.1 chemotaxis protein MotB [Phaeobacter sp. S60]UTS82409.1 Motility protein B [Phaeobacter piscinae]